MKPDSSMYAAHSVDRQPERRPHLLGLEAVAHQVAGLDRELLALVALGLGELRVIVAQREAAEGHVPGLVLHHVGVDRRGERVLRLSRICAKAASARPSISTCMPRYVMSQRESLRTSSQQAEEGRRDRVGELELVVQQPAVGLDVPRLVDHLGGGVELGVDRGHLLDDLRGADERALLPVQELGELPRLEMAPQLGLLRLAQTPEDVGRRGSGWSRRAAARGSPGPGPGTSRCGSPHPTAGPCPSGRASAGTRGRPGTPSGSGLRRCRPPSSRGWPPALRIGRSSPRVTSSPSCRDA